MLFHSILSPFREKKKKLFPLQLPETFQNFQKLVSVLKNDLHLYILAANVPQILVVCHYFRGHVSWLLNFYGGKGNKYWMKVWMKMKVCWEILSFLFYHCLYKNGISQKNTVGIFPSLYFSASFLLVINLYSNLYSNSKNISCYNNKKKGLFLSGSCSPALIPSFAGTT